MTQIFTGEGLGLHGSSLGLGNYGPKGVASLGQGGESVYVNAANGNLVLRQSDGFLADIGFGLDLFQTYNSRGESGSNWCFNMQSRLELSGEVNTSGSIVVRIDEDGHRSRFAFDAKSRTYLPEEGGTARIVFANNGWTYQEGSQKTSSHYSLQGQLIEISDLDGHSVYFTYNQGQLINITDKSGKQKISWSFQNGLLQEVKISSDGKTIHSLHYEYDEQNRLHRVSRDLGQGKMFWITYDYAGDSNWISDIKQSDGTSLHLEYDAQGRVKKLVDGEGRVSSYEYGQGKTTVTNGLGESWTYFYDDKNRLTGIDGPEQYRIRYYYEGKQLSSIVQGNQVWRFEYNEQGDCIRIEEPNGQITQRIFDSEHHLLSETRYQSFDGNHHPVKPLTTRYIYDARGHLLFTIAADGTVTERRYDEEGQITSCRTYLNSAFDISAIGEDELINLEQILSWTASHNPQQVSLIDYQYDWRGQLIEEIHYSTVDSSGKGVGSGASSARYLYDAAGRLIEKSTPNDGDWSITHYMYDDLGRLIQTVDNQNRCQRIEYDDSHNRVIQTDANGLQTISIYDQSGLLITVMRLDTSHSYGSKTYKYDSAGRLIAETGVDGLTIYTFYDQQGRLQARVNTGGQVTEYIYNDEGLLLQTHQYQQKIATSDWQDNLPTYAQIKPKSTGQDRITQLIYNEYNQIAYRIDAEGAVIAYQYDAERQVVSTTAYAERLKNFNPAQIITLNNIQVLVSANDRTLSYYYDSQGRLLAEINGEGYAKSYTYDRLGNLIDTCHYFNASAKLLSGDWLQDKPSNDARRDIHTYALYDGRGLKIAQIDEEGYLTEYIYDERGVLKEQCAYEKPIAKKQVIDSTTSLEQIRPQTSQNDHHTYYKYNDLGLLVEQKTQGGAVTSFVYDEMGQLIVKTLMDEKTHAARQQCYRYDALGRVIQSLDEIGSALLNKPNLSHEEIELIWLRHSISFEYDNAGLLQSKTNALKETTRYFYDENRKLRYTVNPDGAVVETQFNVFDQVELTRKYSAYLKENSAKMTTNQIESALKNLKDDRFDEVTWYEYNNLGLITAKHTGTNGLVTTSYNVFGEIESNSQRIDLNNTKITAFKYDKRGLVTNTVDDVYGVEKKNSIQYDHFGQVIKRIDARGNATSFVLSKRGEQIMIINASNQFKMITYDAFGRELNETDFGHSKNIKEFSYNDQQNIITLTNPHISSQIVTQFDAFGDRIFLKDANGFITEFHYDEKGQLIRVDTPEHGFKEYQYDEAGHLIIQQDAGNQMIQYNYDAEGRVLSKIIDPKGLNLITRYQYDALGRQLQVIEPNGLIKQFVYDNQGNLNQSCIDPHGLNLITTFTYDDRGLLLQQTEINSHGKNKVTAYQWDHLGRRVATITDPDGLKITTTYQYDQNDNLISVTDPNQHSTHYVYDEQNQCRYQINTRGVVTEFQYDINGNKKQIVTYSRPVLLLSEYNEAILKSEIKEDQLRDHYQFNEFDSNDRLYRSFDSLGYPTTYNYDGNDNLIYKCRYSKSVPIEKLKSGDRSLPDADGSRAEYFVYDGLNQLRFKSDNFGNITETKYDHSGKLISRTRYAQRINLDSGRYQSLNYIEEHLKPDVQHDQSTCYAYDKAGRLTLELSSEGIAKSYQYDNLGNLSSSTVYATPLSVSNASSIDNITLQTSNQDRVNHYIYDAAGRECYRISAEGRVLERRYDDVGNIIEEITHSTRVHLAIYNEESIKNALSNERDALKLSNYEYDAAGRLLSEANALKAVTRYSYDTEGNVLSKIEANQACWTYRYDELNQLIETESPVVSLSTGAGQENRSIITRNAYDSFGNIISVVRDAEGIHQILLYEYDASNHKIKTIYPDVKINNSSLSASNQRQEITQTLTEEVKYNGFGEMIASSDKSGNWRHFAYNDRGLLAYSLDTLGGTIYYHYDSFGRLVTKTMYSVSTQLDKDIDYSIETIENARTKSDYDRHEYYVYDRDNRVIEQSRDPIRTYNPKTRSHEIHFKPTTQTVYNAFGEVVKTSVRLNESEWADTFTYYDNDGNKTAVVDAEGYLTAYSYNAFGELEQSTEYSYSLDNWSIDSYSNPRTCSKDRTVVFRYDPLGQLTEKTLKQVSYDRARNNGRSYESTIADLTTTYSYDALGHMTSTTDAKGNTSYCYYNELGQLIAKVAPQTQEGRAATIYAYDALGQLVETRRWAQGVSEATSEHFSLKGASSQDIITFQEYDTSGQLISETDGLKHTVYYSYDANGNLARSWRELRQADNSILIQDKRYDYDSENHLLKTATFKNDGSLKTEDAQYNMFGELIAKGVNGQYTVHVDYDLLGRVWRSNTQGYYQIYMYDLVDHVTLVVTSTNYFSGNYGDKGVDLSQERFETAIYDSDFWRYDLNRQKNTYNALGHLISQSKEYSVKSGDNSKDPRLEIIQQSQTVDRWGNMLSFTNARGFQTTYEYNAFNQVIKQELPEMKVVDEYGAGRILRPVNLYAYDEIGQAIAMVDANGHLVSKEYDAMGRVIKEMDAKGNQRSKQYNLLDQLVSSTNELGGVTTYIYDQMNRLVSVSTPKTHQDYEYDEMGQLIKQRNGAQEETAFWYDSSGNQIKRRDARGYYTNTEYDDAGHKTKETDASGRNQSWLYNNEGKLEQHTDLGGHTSTYIYNTSGLLLEESSTSGKHIKYHYQGDGELIQYDDEAQHEVVNYSYDASGQLISKESGRNDHVKDLWLRETDHYQYDAMGRLIQVRRRNPEDTDNRFPDKDRALLSIDYEYDAVGNIRHTQVSANYTGYEHVENDDYYTYDENNRMLVNKGQLVNGQIVMTKKQGSMLSYDEAGNISDAAKYENDFIQNYHYQYNQDNQLELIKKNNLSIQSKYYDASGRVIQENSFDARGNLSQKNISTYDKGLLVGLSSRNNNDFEVAKTNYSYDEVGNMTKLSTRVNGSGGTAGYTLEHRYSYALWEGYQQNVDEAYLTYDNLPTKTGISRRTFSVNGQLVDAIDAQTDSNGNSNTTHYLNSSVDGIKAREDKDGQTSYLTVAGKTIGDLRLDKQGKQHLNVYGGFTPSGSQQKAKPISTFSWKRDNKSRTANQFLDRASGDVADGTLPEAPQDNLGSYTLQAGDTLESIALHIYGDSSLWYLLADANGISDRNAQASNNGPLHIGQRITTPPIATGQHQTNGTHQILNASQVLGNTNASTASPLPPAPPPLPKRHNGIFAKIVMGIIGIVATVMTAGIVGALAGAAINGGGGLFALGMGILGGTATGTTGAILTAGFAAGFVGSIASQGVAKALGMQEGMDFKGALISGLATAATGGLLRGLNQSTSYSKFVTDVDSLSISKSFSISSAAQMMEQNTLSQSISLTLQKHQHFDWEQLAAAGITGGLMGSTAGKNLSNKLSELDKGTGILTSETKALTHSGAEAAAKGKHFNAVDVITDNLGSAIGEGIMKKDFTEIFNKSTAQFMEELSLENELNKMKAEKQAFNNYLAQQLNESGAYGDTHANHDYIGERTNIVLRDTDTKSLWNNGSNDTLYGSKLLGTIYNDPNNREYSLSVGGGAARLSGSGEGKYNINYDMLIVKTPGKAYRKEQIASYSFYNRSPGSPIAGDASRELQIESIDALISSSIEYGLTAHDTAYVLAIARHESGFNPYAAAGTTSASGLGQFVKDTGRDYQINKLNMWDIEVQTDALVRHFIYNKNLVIQKGLPETYIYKLHHDGPNAFYDSPSSKRTGLKISNEFIIPKIGDFKNVIKNIF